MHADLGLRAESQLDEYSISTTQSQVSGNPTPLYQISKGPLPIVYPGLQNGVQPFQGCTSSAVAGFSAPVTTCSSRNTTLTDPNLRPPYVLTWNLNLQYQGGQRLSAATELRWHGGHRQYRDAPIQRALPENYDANNPAALAAFISNSQVYRPYPNYGTITYRGNISHSTYHGGTVRISKSDMRSRSTMDAFYHLLEKHRWQRRREMWM